MRFRGAALVFILGLALTACSILDPPRNEWTFADELEELPGVESVLAHSSRGGIDDPVTTTYTVELEPGTDESELQQIVLRWRAQLIDDHETRTLLVLLDRTTPPASERMLSGLFLDDPNAPLEALVAQWSALRKIAVVDARFVPQFGGYPFFSFHIMLAAETEKAKRAALDLVPIDGEPTVMIGSIHGGWVTTLDAHTCTATGPSADELWEYWVGPKACWPWHVR